MFKEKLEFNNKLESNPSKIKSLGQRRFLKEMDELHKTKSAIEESIDDKDLIQYLRAFKNDYYLLLDKYLQDGSLNIDDCKEFLGKCQEQEKEYHSLLNSELNPSSQSKIKEHPGNVGFDKIKEILSRCENDIISKLDINENSHPLIAETGYMIIQRIHKDTYKTLSRIVMADCLKYGNELHNSNSKNEIKEILNFFLSQTNKYIEEKRNSGIEKPKYAVKHSPIKPLMSRFFITYSELCSTSPDFVKENLDNSALDTFFKLLEDGDLDILNIEASRFADIFSIDPNYSAEKLLKLLNDKKACKKLEVIIRKSKFGPKINNEKKTELRRINKNRLTDILYRLEFGKIGISKDGVKYLEKMYDLGADNNPDYFTQRLTAKGDIGVFDDQRILQKYFNLGDLSSEEKIIQPKVNQFAYETLFFKREEETEQQRAEREKYLQEFKENYFQFYDNEFFAKTRVRFNNLNFKEQGWFLIYHKSADEEKRRELMEFARQHGENGLKSFLSLEFGEDNGDKILQIGKNLKPGPSHLVFAKIAELADLADKENQELAEKFYKDKEQGTDLSGARLELLKKAHQIIIDFSNELAESKEDNQERLNQLLSDLEKSKIEIDLLAAVLKSAKQQGQAVDFEQIKNLDLTVSGYGQDMADKDKQEVIAIARENWKQIPNMEKEVVEDLEDNLQDTRDQECYILKYQGEIIGFIRFKDLGPDQQAGLPPRRSLLKGTATDKQANRRGPLREKDHETGQNQLYAGSLNIYKDLKGLQIGKYLMQETLAKKAEDNIIKATVSPRLPAGCYYIEKVGFVVNGELNQEKNQSYQYRNEGKKIKK